MSLLRRSAPEEVDETSAEALHALAQQRVRAAIAALGRDAALLTPDDEAPAILVSEPVEAVERVAEDPDPVVAAALERLSACAPELVAEGPRGESVSRVELVHAVLGPLARRDRDADTTAALLRALGSAGPAPDEAALLETGRDPVPQACEPVQTAEALIHQQLLVEGGLRRHVFRCDGTGVERAG